MRAEGRGGFGRRWARRIATVERGKERNVEGHELEVDGPLVGEHTALRVRRWKHCDEFVGAAEVVGSVRGDEGHAEEELCENDDTEEEDGANDANGLR